MRNCSVIFIASYFFIFLFFVENVYGNIRWMAMEKYSKTTDMVPDQICNKTYGLTARQIRFCRHNFQWTPLIRSASSDTVGECQNQLKHRRWNCLSILKAPKYDADLKKYTAEVAFIYALSAVSLALRIANGCMAGLVPECSCRHRNQQRHVSFSSSIINPNDMSNIDALLGCKGIVRLGQTFTRTFTTMGYRRKPKNERQQKETALNKHNVNVGLAELKNGEEISCRCNGVTAGCAFQFCHRRVVQLKDVAKKLLTKYDNAVKINEESWKPTTSLNSNTPEPNEMHADKLLYLTDRPNQCRYQHGYQTISRRQCVLDVTKSNSCQRLCCERGYRARVIEVHSECRCRFVYCCKVMCDTCKSYKNIYECL